MNGLWVISGKWARRERHCVSIVLIGPSLKAGGFDVLQCFQAHLIWTDEAVCQIGGNNCYYWSPCLFKQLQIARDNTIKSWKILLCCRFFLHVRIRPAFVFTSSFFLSQKSWLQQADRHQRWGLRQPAQLERAVSNTHMWFTLRQLWLCPN